MLSIRLVVVVTGMLALGAAADLAADELPERPQFAPLKGPRVSFEGESNPPIGRREVRGEVEVVRDLGPVGYYFVKPPAAKIVRMRLYDRAGRRGQIELTGSREFIRLRLEPGMNRMELDVEHEQAREMGLGGSRLVRNIFWTGT